MRYHFTVDHGYVISICAANVTSSVDFTVKNDIVHYNKYICKTVSKNCVLFTFLLPPDYPLHNQHAGLVLITRDIHACMFQIYANTQDFSDEVADSPKSHSSQTPKITKYMQARTRGFEKGFLE